jgi:hypothetical protein
VDFLTVHDDAAAAAKNIALVPAHVYRIDDGPPMRLERDGAVLAKDVEDLQVVWYYDADTDEVVDAGEQRGEDGEDYETDAVDASELREVRFNLIAATRRDDPRNPDNAGIGQGRENRDTNIPPEDGKHRRVHTATVRLRNLTL